MSLAANFEVGPQGNTVAAADAGSPDAWTSVTVGTGATLTYSNTHAHSGLLSMAVTTTGTSSLDFASWTYGALAEHYGRFYIYTTGVPSGFVPLVRFLDGAGAAAQITLTTGGKLRTADALAATIQTSTNSIAVNQWVRIEYHIIHSATVGLFELKFFNSPESGTPTETLTSAASQNLGAQTTNSRWGVGSALANVGTFWLDDILSNATSYQGSTLKRRPSFSPAILEQLGGTFGS